MKHLDIDLTEDEANALTIELNMRLRDCGGRLERDHFRLGPSGASAMNKIFAALVGGDHDIYGKTFVVGLEREEIG